MSIKILDNPSEDNIIENIKYGLPFKIRGRMNNWPLMKKWNINFFRKNYGNDEISVKNLNIDSFFNYKTCTFNKYLDYIEDKDDKSLYYASDVIIKRLSSELLDDYDMDFIKNIDIFRNYFNFQEFRWVFVGKKGTFTGLHTDIYNTAAWLGLISGKKRFYIYNEEDSDRIREFGNLERTNILKLDKLLETFFDSLNPIIVDVNPGEIIYTPSRLFHFVINLETSIALTENFTYNEIEKDVRLGIYEDGEFSTYLEFIFITNTIFCLIALITVISLLILFFRYYLVKLPNLKIIKQTVL